jgi:hypothetical protein
MKCCKRKIVIALGIIICLGILIFPTRSFWREQLRAYYLGKIQVAAENFQRMPEEIDAVEVFTLSSSQNLNDTNGFYGDYDEPIGTLEHTTLTGVNAKEISELWGAFPVGQQLQSMCFNPVYGLQFKRKGQIYFQTSVCWECSGYTLPVSIFGKTHIAQNGFESKSKGAQKLLEALKKYLPLPPELKKIQPKAEIESTNSISK